MNKNIGLLNNNNNKKILQNLSPTYREGREEINGIIYFLRCAAFSESCNLWQHPVCTQHWGREQHYANPGQGAVPDICWDQAIEAKYCSIWHLFNTRVWTPPEDPAELCDFVRQKLLKGSVISPSAAPPDDPHICFYNVTEQQLLTALWR